MRKWCVLGAIFCLSACATVTVQPTSLTTSFLTEESSLTRSAKEFSKTAESSGWVEKNSTLALIQSKLFNMPGSNTPDLSGYAERLNSDSETGADMHSRISDDLDMISFALSRLNTETGKYLGSDKEPSRSDVVAYEEALVAARRSRKVFEQACDLLNDRDPFLSRDAETRLVELDEQIEIARKLADRLTLSWQNQTDAVS